MPIDNQLTKYYY